MLRKMLAALGLASIALMTFAGSAGAAGNGSVSPNPIPIAPIDPAVGYTWKDTGVTISWTNMMPGKHVYLSICRRPQSDPNFISFGDSCVGVSEVIISPAYQTNGAGSATIPFFRGENPDGDSGWGCYAPGDVAPAGVEKLTTCYVRLASEAQTDTVYSHTVPFTITDDTSSTTTTTTIPGGGNPDPVVPEASNVILLPAVAGGVALLAVAVQRRRRALV